MTDEADKTYRVRNTLTAKRAILEHADFIARQEQAIEPALAWLDRVDAAVARLDRTPRRHNLAEGYGRLPYEVRRVVLANHLILYTVDEAARTVYVVGLIHGARRPRPGDLPPSPADDAGEETRI